MGQRTWIKIYCDKWLEGTLRKESLELRGVWADVLALAGNCNYGDSGKIGLPNNVPLSDEQIAKILHISLEKWVFLQRRLEKTKRIKHDRHGNIHISNWGKYQSEYERTKKYRTKSTTESTPKSYGGEREGERDIKEGAPALLFPLKDGTEYPLGLAKIFEYEKTYRNIDVSFEVKKCLQWNVDNPGKRKTKQGILKHINGWLADESKGKGPQPQAGIEYDNKAVGEARKDVAQADPEKAREKVRNLAKGIGAI